jgi:SAM-dependent methyltransferase
MGFSEEWNNQYKANQQMSIWPWSDLVSYFMRYAKPLGYPLKVLELGCGAGANIPFFLRMGVDYYALEGSDVIVAQLHERFPELKDRISCTDFTQIIPFAEKFDVIVDRASLTHNPTADIKKCLALVGNKLRPGGKFIGIDWFSTAHADYKIGTSTLDPYTNANYEDGQFADVGYVHFSDKQHLEELFCDFNFEVMEHKVVQKEYPCTGHAFASWNFVAIKKGVR